MTRKDFELIADALRRVRPPQYGQGLKSSYAIERQWAADVRELAITLAEVCPRFDQTRFERACGLEVL